MQLDGEVRTVFQMLQWVMYLKLRDVRGAGGGGACDYYRAGTKSGSGSRNNRRERTG